MRTALLLFLFSLVTFACGLADDEVCEDKATEQQRRDDSQQHPQGDVATTKSDDAPRRLVGMHHIEGSSADKPIVVVDNFLGAKFMKQVYDNLAGTDLISDWTPVIGEHVRDFQHQARIQIGKNNESSKLFRPLKPSSAGGLPGIRFNLTEEYEVAFRKGIQSLDLETIYGVPLLYKWTTDSFFGNVCYHPDALSPMQSIPHVDQGWIPTGKPFQREPIRLAVVHYVNPQWNGRGGTAFYMDKAVNKSSFSSSDCSKLNQNAYHKYPQGSKAYYNASGCHCSTPGRHALCASILSERADGGHGYISNSTAFYQMVQHVPYQFDRAVIYSPHMLHSAYLLLDEEERPSDDVLDFLSCVPAEGRLTANLFLA
jgi:hypothetical protein